VTRNASSEAAKKLASRGVQVVTADLWDKNSIKDALTGCEGVFGVRINFSHILQMIMVDRAQVTNYYDPSIVGAKPQGEIEQGRLLIDVAKEVGVQFFVWRFVELANPGHSSLTPLQFSPALNQIVEWEVSWRQSFR